MLGGHLPQAQVDSGRAADEFRVRFQQTCGPVMAKGIEDTAFYRAHFFSYGDFSLVAEVVYYVLSSD